MPPTRERPDEWNSRDGWEQERAEEIRVQLAKLTTLLDVVRLSTDRQNEKMIQLGDNAQLSTQTNNYLRAELNKAKDDIDVLKKELNAVSKELTLASTKLKDADDSASKKWAFITSAGIVVFERAVEYFLKK